jgi:ubiquinol oxidase
MQKLEHEALVAKLKDPVELAAYAKECDDYRPGFLARVLGAVLVGAGNLVYGTKPSYEKFKAVEVIARIPYQSWEAVAYTYLTAFYGDEGRAIRLSRLLPFARHAQDNETMHVVVITHLVKQYHRNSFIRHTLVPLVFSFFYYWAIWLLSLIDRRVAFELNYIFESHAFHQYTEFLEREGERMKSAPIASPFLTFYGREVENEYDLFESIRLDEIIHRNASVEMIKELDHGRLS